MIFTYCLAETGAYKEVSYFMSWRTDTMERVLRNCVCQQTIDLIYIHLFKL
jgi:hypothetical protein